MFFEGGIQNIILLFLVGPAIVWGLCYVFKIALLVKFIVFSCYVSFAAIFYTVYVLSYIMRQDTGTDGMKSIANIIVEGSEGFFIAQYGTIFKLSFLFAFGITLTYYLRDNSQLLKQVNNSMSNTVLSLFIGICFM